jgi:hypothetical protein
MNLDDKRSPEKILRYFELLEWKKKECEGKTREEIREKFRQELQPIEEELHTVEHLITEKSKFLLADQGETDQVRLNISCAEESILSIRRDITSARNKMAEHRQIFLKEDRLTPSGTSKYPNVSMLGLMGISVQLFIIILEDIRALLLDIWQAIITIKILILAQYVLSLLIVIIFANQFGHYANAIFSLVPIALYLCFKFSSILRRINKNQQALYEKRENFWKEAYRQKQILESYINELEKRNEVQERYLAQQRIQEKELGDRIQSIDNDVMSLKKRQERLIEFKKDKYSEIEKYKSLLEELFYLDKLTENWLEQEVEERINKAKKKLQLIERDYSGERGALEIDPIRSLIGCTSRTLPGQLVNDEDEDSPRRKEILQRYADDAKSEDDYGGKRRRCGLYEFTVFSCVQISLITINAIITLSEVNLLMKNTVNIYTTVLSSQKFRKSRQLCQVPIKFKFLVNA